MERPAQIRKRRKDAPLSSKRPGRLPRDRMINRKIADRWAADGEQTSPTTSGRARTDSHGSEAARTPSRTEGSVRTTGADEDVSVATRMTVTNVGRGGTLYLKPSRLGVNNIGQLPASPPATSESDCAPADDTDRPADRNNVGTASLSIDSAMARTPELKRVRSHSFTSTNERPQMGVSDLADGDPMYGGQWTPQRRNSAANALSGLLELQIPHYRLGSPRFSERGGAYLRNSTFTVSSDGAPLSSIASRSTMQHSLPPAPMPPTRNLSSFASQQASPGQTYLHPITAHMRHPSSIQIDLNRLSIADEITPEIFDRLEAHPNDPSVVHRHPLTGKILAATPARLIAQITSPQFLDYNLLSDFFLTFRCFMPAHDVLEYLFARMTWAFEKSSDAGRIVRVRTFVALRHWILNYFPDDFLLDMQFRERFCELINTLTKSLRQRQDRGGSDMNIIGELKKCWQRTCELYWPIPNPRDVLPDDDVTPGGEQRLTPFGPSVLSLPLTIRPATRGDSSIFEVAQIRVPDQTKNNDQSPRTKRKPPHHLRDLTGPTLTRTASIPTSPMSELSLDILSCSVPFLQQLRSAKVSSSAPSSRHTHRHQRSGSFSDALRNHRTTSGLNSQADNVDSTSFTVSGGLVRGILLEPCPSKVNLAAPPSPTINPTEAPAPLPVEYPTTSDRQIQNSSVKKLVGEMRRALSSRRALTDHSLRSHRSKQSFSDMLSLGGNSVASTERKLPVRTTPPPVPAVRSPPPGPPRLDILAARVEHAYHMAFEHIADSSSESTSAETPRPGEPDDRGSGNFDLALALENGKQERSDSRLTTSSRSILIFDATGAPEVPVASGALPAESGDVPASAPPERIRSTSVPNIDLSVRPPTLVGDNDPDHWRASVDAHLHDFLSVPGTLSSGTESATASRLQSRNFVARKSSLIHPEALNLPALQQQLRRRPGTPGDLRLADNIFDLAPSRPYSMNTFSSNTHSVATSAFFSRHPSKVRYSSQVLGSGRYVPSSARGPGGSIALLNPSIHKNIRASFESDARRLKSIPDQDSDGGIEDALAKLEGKIPSPSRSTFAREQAKEQQNQTEEAATAPSDDTALPAVKDAAGTSTTEERGLSDEPRGASPSNTETPGASIYHLSDSAGYPSENWSVSRMIPPPLDLGLAPPVGATRTPSPRMAARISHLTPEEDPYPPGSKESSMNLGRAGEGEPTDGDGEITLKLDDGVMNDIARGQAVTSESEEVGNVRNEPKATVEIRNDDLDDNDDDNDDTVSDISTEIADQPEMEPAMRSFYFDDTTEDRVRRYQEQIREQARAHAKKQMPPTPPSTTVASKSSGGRAPSKNVERKVVEKRTQTPLPERPLKASAMKSGASTPKLRSPPPNRPLPQPPVTAPAKPDHNMAIMPTLLPENHMPFILAFESEVIAEQLTIIEKDALDEVDWKDLISLNWQQNPASILNWVSYLKDEASNGIDVVIARFNLVVKWVISEVLLTTVPSERARAITKFIHIASHCHRLRNYASLYQITLALLSSDLIRLHMTWALVPMREKETLAQLEGLCQPLRNFNNLRVEMEGIGPDAGCIPFIGLYTHDLMFNAQKPSRLEPVMAGKEPLVNFERYQTAAGIVKGLLRMIEASAKYNFKPHPEALSRCLWIAALEDREIAARSTALEIT